MAIYVNNNREIVDIYVSVNGEKKSIISAYINHDNIIKKVFGTSPIHEIDPYETAPAEAYNNWNYTLDDDNSIIILNYYKGSETDVIVYANYVVNEKNYKTQLTSHANNTQAMSPYMFNGFASKNCKYIKNIKFSKSINTNNVTNMYGMFMFCTSLEYLDISGFDTSNVTSMASMFSNCSSLLRLDLSNFRTNNVTGIGIQRMFENCTSLTKLNVENFDTSEVTNMIYMFYNCSSLTTLDLSSFNTQNVTIMDYLFNQCSKLTKIYVSDKWKTVYHHSIFSGCGASEVTII